MLDKQEESEHLNFIWALKTANDLYLNNKIRTDSISDKTILESWFPEAIEAEYHSIKNEIARLINLAINSLENEQEAENIKQQILEREDDELYIQPQKTWRKKLLLPIDQGGPNSLEEVLPSFHMLSEKKQSLLNNATASTAICLTCGLTDDLLNWLKFEELKLLLDMSISVRSLCDIEPSFMQTLLRLPYESNTILLEKDAALRQLLQQKIITPGKISGYTPDQLQDILNASKFLSWLNTIGCFTTDLKVNLEPDPKKITLDQFVALNKDLKGLLSTSSKFRSVLLITNISIFELDQIDFSSNSKDILEEFENHSDGIKKAKEFVPLKTFFQLDKKIRTDFYDNTLRLITCHEHGYLFNDWLSLGNNSEKKKELYLLADNLPNVVRKKSLTLKQFFALKKDVQEVVRDYATLTFFLTPKELSRLEPSLVKRLHDNKLDWSILRQDARLAPDTDAVTLFFNFTEATQLALLKKSMAVICLITTCGFSWQDIAKLDLAQDLAILELLLVNSGSVEDRISNDGLSKEDLLQLDKKELKTLLTERFSQEGEEIFKRLHDQPSSGVSP